MATKKSSKTAKRTAKKGGKAAATATAKKAKAKVSAKKASKVRPTKKPAARAPRNDFGDALVRALTVAIIADGEIASSERQMLARFAKEPALRGVDVAAIAEQTIERCISDGPEAVLADVASKIRSKDDRETAFSSCLAVIATDGQATASEVRMLRAFAEGLRIPRTRVKQLAGPMAAAFG